MRLLLKSIVTLASLALLAALAANKIGGLFPEMDRIAWSIVLTGFGLETHRCPLLTRRAKRLYI